MYQLINEIEYRGIKLEIAVVKSSPNCINNKDEFDYCWESAISDKAIIRYAVRSGENIFFKPTVYEYNMFNYESDSSFENFIEFNKRNKPNEHFVCFYIDLEIDELTNKIAEISENYRKVDKITNVVKNIIEQI